MLVSTILTLYSACESASARVCFVIVAVFTQYFSTSHLHWFLSPRTARSLLVINMCRRQRQHRWLLHELKHAFVLFLLFLYVFDAACVCLHEGDHWASCRWHEEETIGFIRFVYVVG